MHADEFAPKPSEINSCLGIVAFTQPSGGRFLPNPVTLESVSQPRAGPDKPLDIRVSSLVANQGMKLTAKSPHLSNWFSQDGPDYIAELDLSGDGSDSPSCRGRTIPV